MTAISQETQIRNSEVYDDTLSAGATLEKAEGSDYLQTDLNALRSQIKRIIKGAGSGNWYSALKDNFGLDAIHDKIFVFAMPYRQNAPNASNFTLIGAPSGVLLNASMFSGGAGIIAVGPSSSADGGYVAADEANFTVAGTLGVGLSEALDANGVLLNQVDIVSSATNEAPKTINDEVIFGLLQTITGTADGAAIAAASSENLQISFVYLDKTTDLLTATTLPAGTYHFAPRRQATFYSLSRGAFLGSPPPFVDSSGASAAQPFREIQITGTKPNADDSFDINSGTFTTAGAQTVVSSNGTCALPATGAAFRDDPRIKVFRNGVLQSKGASGAANRDVYWVSTTQLAFETKLKKDEVIYIETLASY